MKKYKCIKELELQIYDENDCLTDNYAVVHKGSVYEYADGYVGESDIRMYLEDGDDDFGYIDITFETFNKCFERIS